MSVLLLLCFLVLYLVFIISKETLLFFIAPYLNPVMTDYHFKYSGEVIIAADTYEEAEKLLKNMMWDVRGVYNYQIIHSSVSVPDYGDEDT